MALRVLDQSVDGLTGFITCRVRVEETGTNQGQPSLGPEETLAIDPKALLLRHHPADTDPTPETMHRAILDWFGTHHDRVLARKQRLDHTRAAVAMLGSKALFEKTTASIEPGTPTEATLADEQTAADAAGAAATPTTTASGAS